MSKLRSVFGDLLCQLGFHDYRVLEKKFQFGSGSGIEKVECRRCGVIVTRQGSS
jgi:hypothetical protein